MTFPPGRARLATRPSPMGSPTLIITMGIVSVAFRAATAAGVGAATMMSGSAGRARRRAAAAVQDRDPRSAAR